MKKILIPIVLCITMIASCKKDDSPAPAPVSHSPTGISHTVTPELEQSISVTNAHLDWTYVQYAARYYIKVWYYNSANHPNFVIDGRYTTSPIITTFADSLIGKKMYWTVTPEAADAGGNEGPTSSFYLIK